jgi:hypothetical protein
METKRDRDFDDYLKNVIQEVGLDSPSVDFTLNVMGKIKLAKNPPIIVSYKPLISKFGWAIFSLCVLAVFILVFLEGNASQNDYFSGPKWDILTDSNFWEKTTNWHISKTVSYGFTFLALFISIQIVLLKRHFDKRFKLH